MAPYKLLNHTKRVIVSLGRCKADRLVEELVAELHLVETVNANVDRTETPPFFRCFLYFLLRSVARSLYLILFESFIFFHFLFNALVLFLLYFQFVCQLVVPIIY